MKAVVVPLENIAKQLESVAILTNALILTEAVRSENISVGEIMINSLIIGQMPKDINWIEMLGSVKLDAAKVDTFKKLVTEMKALKITFEKEEPVDVPVNLLTKLNPDALQSLSKIAASFSNLLDVNSSSVGLVHDYKKSMVRFILLPYTAEAIKKSGNFSELDELVKVVSFIEKTQKTGFKLLEDSVNECKTSDQKGDKNKESLRRCLSKLKELTESIKESIPSLKNATMAFNFLSVASHISNIKNLTKIEESINGTIQQLGTILPLLEQIRNAANNEKPKISFQQIVTDLNSLKESSLGRESLKKSLDMFIPVAQAVEKMIDLYGTGNMRSSISSNEISFLNAFKSYKCLPNGADSMNILKDVLGSSQSLSLEYIMSGIVARLPVIEEYVSIYNPIIQNSAGLKAVEQLSTGISNLTANSNPIITSNLSGTFDEIIKIIPEVSGIVESLKFFVAQIKQLKQKSNWENDLSSLNKPSIFSNDEFDSLTEIFLIVPEYLEFVSKIQNVLLDVNVSSSDHSVLKSYYEKIKDIFDSLPTAVEIAGKIDEIKKTDLSVMKQIAETVPEMQEALRKGKTFKVSELKPTKNVDLKAALDSIERASSIPLVFKKIKLKKTEIQSFAKEIEAINIFSNSLKPITDEDVRSTQVMLTGMKEIRERKTTLTESYQVATLMEGNPFGNDILDNMYKGINDYQMIAKRIGSLKNVYDAIDQLDGNEQLMADIRKFLKGAEVMEITPVENTINVYDVIMNIPSIISNLEKLEKWIRISLEKNEKTTIEKQLNDLKSNDSPMVQQISMIHFFVHKIDQNFAENVLKLRKGFEVFERKLTYVDCKKNPKIPRCHNVTKGSTENLKRNSTIGQDESNDSELETIVICVIVFIVVVFFMTLGLVIYNRYSAAKKMKRYSTIQHFLFTFGILPVIEEEDIKYKCLLMIQFELLSLENKPRNFTKKIDKDMIRNPEIGLYKKNRVKLNSEVNGVIRVHASYIQMHNSKWIVCQAPLPKDNCNEAMFEMLLQENVKVIVQFRGDDEEVTYCASGKYGRYEVTKTIVTENEPIDHCTLKVVDKKKNIDVTINHLQLRNSPGFNRPEIFSVIDLMEKVQELSGKGVVLVHCLDGIDMSILFVSMVHMTDMLNDGKKVIIRDVANNMRKQRYGALSTVRQYAYLLGLMTGVCAKKNPKEEEKSFQILSRMLYPSKKEKKDEKKDEE